MSAILTPRKYGMGEDFRNRLRDAQWPVPKVSVDPEQVGECPRCSERLYELTDECPQCGYHLPKENV